MLVVLVRPGIVQAHPGGEPFIHVPADQIEQGQPFSIVGADLGEGSAVTLGLAAGEVVVPLGTVTAGPDGHFETTMILPVAVPVGYVQLRAQSEDGSEASTWVRVAAAGDLGAPATPARNGPPVVDASLVIVASIAVLLLAFWLVSQHRGRSRTDAAGGRGPRPR